MIEISTKTYIEEILQSLIDLEKAMVEKKLTAKEIEDLRSDMQYILVRANRLESYLRLL